MCILDNGTSRGRQLCCCCAHFHIFKRASLGKAGVPVKDGWYEDELEKQRNHQIPCPLPFAVAGIMFDSK